MLLRVVGQTGINAHEQQPQNTELHRDQRQTDQSQHGTSFSIVQPIVSNNRQIAVKTSAISIKPERTAST